MEDKRRQNRRQVLLMDSDNPHLTATTHASYVLLNQVSLSVAVFSPHFLFAVRIRKFHASLQIDDDDGDD